jgi:hypothetical protein
MNYVKAASSAFAATSAALLIWAVALTPREPGVGWTPVRVPALLTQPLFWVLTILIFGALFVASRLSRRIPRILLFWAPTAALSTLGLGVLAFAVYVWIHS